MAATSGRAGFTLIEMIIVMLVVAILAVSVIPKLVSTTQISAQLAADIAASDIKAVQAGALYMGSARNITFSGNSYTAEGLIPPTRSLPGNASAGNCTITFNSFGEPSPPAGGGNNQFSITAGEESRTITVQALTGKVTIN